LSRRRVERLASAVLLGVLGVGCTAARKPEPGTPCPARASRAAAAAICGRDGSIDTLRARFRADVDAAGAARSAEGVLVWRAPGALRVKLFTLAGLTVYDALWVGDGERVRGVVRQPLSARDESFDLGPGERIASPDADLSLLLWALWQPRCAAPPVAHGAEPQRFTLDAASARALQREVVVTDGEVSEETLVQQRAAGDEERVVARYEDYDCAQEPALPRHIEIEAPANGWRARVTILEQSRNMALDDGLFAVPDVKRENASH
jgi:hypothetical protein